MNWESIYTVLLLALLWTVEDAEMGDDSRSQAKQKRLQDNIEGGEEKLLAKRETTSNLISVYLMTTQTYCTNLTSPRILPCILDST